LSTPTVAEVVFSVGLRMEDSLMAAIADIGTPLKWKPDASSISKGHTQKGESVKYVHL
jgi:hypothetical protein